MVRRALTVLFAVLATACAGAAGFADAPHAGQIMLLAGACIFAAAVHWITAPTLPAPKKAAEAKLGTGRHLAAPASSKKSTVAQFVSHRVEPVPTPTPSKKYCYVKLGKPVQAGAAPARLKSARSSHSIAPRVSVGAPPKKLPTVQVLQPCATLPVKNPVHSN